MIEVFFKFAVVTVVLVLLAMMLLSAFTIKLPFSKTTTTTVGDTTVTTTCSWLRFLSDDSDQCTTTVDPAPSKSGR